MTTSQFSNDAKEYGISSLDTAFELESSQWVGPLYIMSGSDSNGRWFSLPSYFAQEVAILDG